MACPLSGTFSYIDKVKMGNDVVRPSKFLFYRRFADDIDSRQKSGENILHNLIIDVNSGKFLETKLISISGAYKFNVYRKNTNLPSPCISKTPKCYKRNTINGNLLDRSKSITPNFDEEISLIKEKVMKTDYPWRFMNSVANDFQKCKECGNKFL